jgi:hypothetical protein
MPKSSIGKPPWSALLRALRSPYALNHKRESQHDVSGCEICAAVAFVITSESRSASRRASEFHIHRLKPPKMTKASMLGHNGIR